MVSSVSVGMVVAGRYTLERCINRGGIGSLWLARDEQSDSFCGLRLAESTGQGIVELAARYLAEVDVVGRIRCENIIDVLDYGEWNGLPFLVVEHVEGEELSTTLVHKGRMQPKAAYRIIAQTARALARAHAAGIVHGDLTPEHILITSDGMQPMAKVFNFGLSQRGAEVGVTNSTRIGSFLRLPYYSSPEKVSNKASDWRSDLWSLAIISYECLVGHKPFDTSSFAELLTLITCDPIAPIILPGGRTPSTLQSWWEKATTRDPNERFQSAKELADALGKSFGFPLVFVPEPTSATLGPQASPASLPIVLRDAGVPSSSRPPPRVPTPNPKLKSYPAPSIGRPMQVAVRSSSPVPAVGSSSSNAFRHSTAIGLGAVSPPNVMPKSIAPRVFGELDAKESTVGSGPEHADAPPSSLKIDVDVVPASGGSGSQQEYSQSEGEADVSDDEEDLNGFPLSEAPTVARKLPPEPIRRVVLKGASNGASPSVPSPGRHRAAWLTAAALVIAGTIGAARLMRVDKHPGAAVASNALATTSPSQFNTPQQVDAGPNNVAETSDDESPLNAAQLQAKLADELARVTAATDGAAADKGAADGRKPTAKTPAKASMPRTTRGPSNPAEKPEVQSPQPAESSESAPTKPPENSKPGTSIEREYGI